ncbi:unnamed protein product [Dovyalis caffra]|uniref:Uncharacterized protein n=1 Tax=Dovyalis caffra TaxID=77055 RepID=A0AAV1RYE5_9ROSI|nr:unnamed protein product [Dovyalis caffra]
MSATRRRRTPDPEITRWAIEFLLCQLQSPNSIEMIKKLVGMKGIGREGGVIGGAGEVLEGEGWWVGDREEE